MTRLVAYLRAAGLSQLPIRRAPHKYISPGAAPTRREMDWARARFGTPGDRSAREADIADEGGPVSLGKRVLRVQQTYGSLPSICSSVSGS